MHKTHRLKDLINSPKLEFIMEAHNGLSAKVVEEANFKGIWASGLSISASLGVRDNNEASWTQILEVLEFMSDASKIPILLDGDTGYGNFNNMRRLVKKLEQRHIDGVCIEDKIFPKTNSFIRGDRQPLAEIDEFCGKIKAAKDTQSNPDFVVVARVEAFIAGWSLNEALRRAEAYNHAGADAILVHSNKADPSDIEIFMKEWGNRAPVIIVPTKYYSTPTERFREWGISLVIWANHCLRSAITAMQSATRQIYRDESLINVEDKMASVAEIFRLQGADELEAAEDKYLPTAGKIVNAIVLAAAQGESLGELTKQVPKTLLKVAGKSILDHQIDSMNQMGIKDISVVRGFAKEKIGGPNFSTIDNNDHAKTRELYSLYLARQKLGENTIISYGDILFKSYILHDLLNDNNDITILVDADRTCRENGSDDYRDFVTCDLPYTQRSFLSSVHLQKMSSGLLPIESHGEFIGLWKLMKNGAGIVKNIMEDMANLPHFQQMRMSDFFNVLVQRHPVSVKYIKGSWLDIDTIADLQKAGGSEVC